MPMRVLHVYKTYYPDSFGGVEQVIRQLCRGTTPLGIENEIFVLTHMPAAEPMLFEGCRVHRAKRDIDIASTGFSFSALSRFARLSREFDVIHYHFPWPFMDMMHFLGKINQPSIVSYHADIVRQQFLLRLYRPLQHRFLTAVDRIVATSPNYFSSSPTLQRYRDKVAIITYGLDPSSYPIPADALLTHWRQRCGPRFFLFIGMLRYYKGLHVLLNAAKGTDYPIFIVGTGPLEHALKQQAQRLGLDKVVFLGALSELDKGALLALAEVLVFPSHLRAESFGIALLEGAMHGKPMISCEIGSGTSYINLAGETGLVVPPENPLALRAAMTHLWTHPDIAQAMGAGAKRRYQQLFTAEKMAADYAALYRQVIQENNPLTRSSTPKRRKFSATPRT